MANWPETGTFINLGSTMEEIVELLKLCVVQGIQACNLGVPILSEELEKRSTTMSQW